MDVYKAKIYYDGSLKKLKSRIVVRGDMKNKELVGKLVTNILHEYFEIFLGR